MSLLSEIRSFLKRKTRQFGKFPVAIRAAFVTGAFVLLAVVLSPIADRIFSAPPSTSVPTVTPDISKTGTVRVLAPPSTSVPTVTPDISKTGTARAFTYEPWLESSGYLAISRTRNWKPGQEDPIFQDAHQVFDVPIEVLEIMETTADTYYIWQMVRNANPTPESCGSKIRIQGPVWLLGGEEIEPFSTDLGAKLEAVFPSATIATFSTSRGQILASLQGNLIADTSSVGPILLFFYPKPTSGSGVLCSGDTLGVPLGAFHYISRNEELLPEEYILQQLGIIMPARVGWTMAATKGVGIVEDTTYWVETFSFLPSRSR